MTIELFCEFLSQHTSLLVCASANTLRHLAFVLRPQLNGLDDANLDGQPVPALRDIIFTT
jgi:hypothetical protein